MDVFQYRPDLLNISNPLRLSDRDQDGDPRSLPFYDVVVAKCNFSGAATRFLQVTTGRHGSIWSRLK